MKNTVTASIEFYFKGEKFSPSITVELDEHLHTNGSLDNLCAVIATENNIDHYSYEYEMMQAETIKFKNAQGLIENFITNEELDAEAFESAWQEHRALAKLLEIAERHMHITDFAQHTELKQALLAAFQLGQADPK